jgi:hypothetical protein
MCESPSVLAEIEPMLTIEPPRPPRSVDMRLTASRQLAIRPRMLTLKTSR